MKNGPYELVVAPRGYPGKRYRGRYCYEHHLVLWKTTGRIPGPGEEAHHKDECKRHNAPGNLAIISKADHQLLHGQKRSESSPIRHGGFSAYKRRKCRCALCCAWYQQYKAKALPYQRAWRAARRAATSPP